MLSGLVQYSDDSDDDVEASKVPAPEPPQEQKKALPSAKDLLGGGAKVTPTKKRSIELPVKEQQVKKWQRTDQDELLMVPPQMRSGRPNIVTEESSTAVRRKKSTKK